MKKVLCTVLVCICITLCAVPTFADDSSSVSASSSSSSSEVSDSASSVPDTPFTEFVPVLISDTWEFFSIQVTGSYQLNAKSDLGTVMIQNGKVIIDEAGVEFNNRDYKSFSSSAIYFFKYHRHYRLSVDVFSQSYEDMDVTIRRLARNFYVVKKSLVPFCVTVRLIRRSVGIDEQSHQIIDAYNWGIPVLQTKRIFSPTLWKLFNTYSCKDLPPKIGGWLSW